MATPPEAGLGGRARGRRGSRCSSGRRILIVDDDVRNVFALTSALEQHGIDVLYAENGEEGLGRCAASPTSTWS